jgi:hypothetical protein
MAFFTDTEIETAIKKKAPGIDLDFARQFLHSVERLRATYSFPLVYRHALNACKVWNEETRKKLCSIAGTLYGTRGTRVARKNKASGRKRTTVKPVPQVKIVLRGKQYELVI